MLEGGIKSGPEVYSAGFLPAAFQGTTLREGPAPILNLKPAKASHADQRDMLDTLRWFNERHLETRSRRVATRSARIDSYELAFRDADGGAGAGGSIEGNRRHPKAVRHGRDGHCGVRRRSA